MHLYINDHTKCSCFIGIESLFPSRAFSKRSNKSPLLQNSIMMHTCIVCMFVIIMKVCMRLNSIMTHICIHACIHVCMYAIMDVFMRRNLIMMHAFIHACICVCMLAVSELCMLHLRHNEVLFLMKR
jgi:hypothetical protein